MITNNTPDEVIAQYVLDKDKSKIEEIVNEIKRADVNNLKLTPYCERRIGGDEKNRGFDEALLWDTLPKFELVKIVNIRKLRFGDLSYDLHYELSGNRTLIISICIKTKQIINAILKYQKWSNLVKKFYAVHRSF